MRSTRFSDKELGKDWAFLRAIALNCFVNLRSTVNQSESHGFQTDGRGLQASEPSSDDSPS